MHLRAVYILILRQLKKITKAYFEIVKKELPEEALNFEVNDFILEEIKAQIKSKKICL